MEKRKLATIQYIHHITPIEGADRIECIHVLGWQCVANKGLFRVGDKCVYMEVEERVTNSGTVIVDFPECIPSMYLP